MRVLLPLLLATAASPLAAATLEFPSNATLSHETISSPDRYDMPIGAYAGSALPTLPTTGEITRQSWQIDGTGLTTFQLLSPFLKQLTAADFTLLFECESDACGGFDFRFAIDVIPAPDMFINLGDFRYVAAEKQGDSPEYISIIVSRSSTQGFIQLIRSGPPDTLTTNTDAETTRATLPDAIAPADFNGQLETLGRVILTDLAFETGSAALGEETFASLEELANYLSTNPDKTVALVGHTDSQGSLDGNIALSKRRAGSVLERLVTAYDIPRRQLEAEGMGYLAPIATNLTEVGRTANRRVEVIITSTN